MSAPWTGSGAPISGEPLTPAELVRMVNAYIGLTEIKAACDVTTADYDALFVRTAQRASRLLDAITMHRFYPSLAVVEMDGSAHRELWLQEPLLEIEQVEVSHDYGSTYTVAPSGGYRISNGARYNAYPIRLLIASAVGTLVAWPGGESAVRIAGVWGWHDAYPAAWVDALSALTAPANVNSTTLAVSNAAGAAQDGYTPRFEIGTLLRIDSEYIAVTGISGNTLTVVRGCNGTSPAVHVQGTRIDIWRAPDIIRQAALIQTVRWFKRGQQGFQDVSAGVVMGQLTYATHVDPEIEYMLQNAGIKDLAL